MSIAIETYQNTPVNSASAASANPTERSLRLLLNVHEVRASCGQIEWRGTLVNVDNGLTAVFEDWPELVEQIAEALYKLRLHSLESRQMPEARNLITQLGLGD